MTPSLTGDCLMTITVECGPPVEVGVVDGYVRRYVPFLGGHVEGRYRGTVAPGGTDWQTVAPGGRVEVSARYVLYLEHGTVEVQSTGLRAGSAETLARLAAGEILPPEAYYFRTAMRFFTASPALAALNDLLAVAVGTRLPRQAVLRVHPVL